jgi:CRP-like cAMP-binding protein
MIVRTGVLLVTRHEQGIETELTRLAPGDCFGEGGVLTDVEEVGKITALTFAVVYEIAQETLADLMRERPILAEELGLMLSQRLEAEHKLIGALRRSSNDNHAHSLAEKIRHLFQLRRAG